MIRDGEALIAGIEHAGGDAEVARGSERLVPSAARRPLGDGGSHGWPSRANLGSLVVSVAGIRVDGLRQRIEWDGSTIHLPPREMAAMLALVAAPGAPVASADLARRIWPGSALVTSYDVRRVIYQLRSSLRASRIPVTISNVRGWGYSLELPS